MGEAGAAPTAGPRLEAIWLKTARRGPMRAVGSGTRIPGVGLEDNADAGRLPADHAAGRVGVGSLSSSEPTWGALAAGRSMMPRGASVGPRRRCLVALAAASLWGCEPEPAGFAPPRQAGTLGVEGADLYTLSLGAGEPIIAVHGGPALDHSYLLPGLEPLAETFRLILYDQRGVGASPAALDTASISMTRYLDDLDAVRERVARTEAVTVLAHSWGSIPATLYAMRWPQRVRALILMNPVEPGQRYGARAEANQQARRAEADRRAIDSLRALPEFLRGDARLLSQLMFHVFRGTFADPAVADSSLSLRLAERTARQGGNVARLLLTPLAGLDLWDELPRLDVPVLVLHGDHDPMPAEMAREMVAALPDARLVTLEGVGHFPYIEAPGETFGEIARFLRDLDARPE